MKDKRQIAIDSAVRTLIDAGCLKIAVAVEFIDGDARSVVVGPKKKV